MKSGYYPSFFSFLHLRVMCKYLQKGQEKTFDIARNLSE